MQVLTLAEADALADEIDRAAAATPQVDTFCSASAWALSAAGTLGDSPEPWLRRGDHAVVLAQRLRHADGFSYLAPLECMWGLQAAVLGADPVAATVEALAVLRADASWRLAVWPGFREEGPQFAALARALPRGFVARLGVRTLRHVASLAGGVEGFLSRRSPNLRRTLRRADRDARAQGVTFELARPHDEGAADAAFARLVAVEERSWKAREDVGLRPGGFREFYARMARRLAARGRLRAVFARRGDVDVAYSLGGVFADTYRGLQFSYDDRESALSLGGLCQLRQIEALAAEEPDVARYDLGGEMAYKRRWAEGELVTRVVVIQR